VTSPGAIAKPRIDHGLLGLHGSNITVWYSDPCNQCHQWFNSGIGSRHGHAANVKTDHGLRSAAEPQPIKFGFGLLKNLAAIAIRNRDSAGRVHQDGVGPRLPVTRMLGGRDQRPQFPPPEPPTPLPSSLFRSGVNAFSSAKRDVWANHYPLTVRRSHVWG
jgi:hypothetical protein